MGREDLDALWEKICPLSIDGAPARQLCPEDNLLHLCLHFMGNFNFRS